MYEIIRVVNTGTFSLVSEARLKNDDDARRYAIKRIYFNSKNAPFYALNEQKMLQTITESTYSSFLPRLHQTFLLHESPFIVTDFVGEKSLRDVMRQVGLMSEVTARFYIAEILCALEKIHRLGIVHLDLRPENILLHDSGHIVLTSFDRAYDIRANRDDGTVADDRYFTGKPMYMAPEVARMKTISVRSDIWSLGMMSAEMVSGHLRPLNVSKWTQLALAQRGEFTIANEKKLSPQMRSFLYACLIEDYSCRHGWWVLKMLQYFGDLHWYDVESLKMSPPYKPSELDFKPRIVADLSDPEICDLPFALTIPEKQKDVFKGLIPLSRQEMDKNGFTRERLNEMFKDFCTISSMLFIPLIDYLLHTLKFSYID